MRRALAKLHASRGDLAEAERLLNEALGIVERTDSLPLHGEALRDLAHLHLLAGRRSDAIETLEAALAIHERKGAAGWVNATRAEIAALRRAA
jgi:tetratricopeptide (TPR) repeat protein